MLINYLYVFSEVYVKVSALFINRLFFLTSEM